jgi:hypothetical protein
MSDLIQSLCNAMLAIGLIIQAYGTRSLQRQIDDLRRNDADLAQWVIHHDPDLYETWQQRHPPTN